jgi:hypothetical protein
MHPTRVSYGTPLYKERAADEDEVEDVEEEEVCSIPDVPVGIDGIVAGVGDLLVDVPDDAVGTPSAVPQPLSS